MIEKGSQWSLLRSVLLVGWGIHEDSQGRELASVPGT